MEHLYLEIQLPGVYCISVVVSQIDSFCDCVENKNKSFVASKFS